MSGRLSEKTLQMILAGGILILLMTWIESEFLLKILLLLSVVFISFLLYPYASVRIASLRRKLFGSLYGYRNLNLSLTGERLVEIADSLQSLSEGFRQNAGTVTGEPDKNLLMEELSDKMCRNCSSCENCWELNAEASYRSVCALLEAACSNGTITVAEVPQEMLALCIQAERYVEELNQRLEQNRNSRLHYRQQEESRGMIAEQLAEVATAIRRSSHVLCGREESVELQKQVLVNFLHTERLRRKMTLKQVARLGGVSEGYLKDVEEGKRIIADDQARRILKKMGLKEHNEAGFSLEDIAATVDVETIAPKKPAPAKTAVKESEAVYQSKAEETVSGGILLDALTSVLKRVPVYNAVMKEVGHRLLPIMDGKIEGSAPDKVFYLSAPDDSMRGFRILREDQCLIVPSNSPIDGAIMMVEYNHHRCIRKVKKLDGMNVLLQSYDREYNAETAALPEITFIGRVVRVEFTL